MSARRPSAHVQGETLKAGGGITGPLTRRAHINRGGALKERLSQLALRWPDCPCGILVHAHAARRIRRALLHWREAAHVFRCIQASSAVAPAAISSHRRRNSGPISFQGYGACDQSKPERLDGPREAARPIPGAPDCRSRPSITASALERSRRLWEAPEAGKYRLDRTSRENGVENGWPGH
jgi:hypothetical protein